MVARVLLVCLMLLLSSMSSTGSSQDQRRDCSCLIATRYQHVKPLKNTCCRVCSSSTVCSANPAVS